MASVKVTKSQIFYKGFELLAIRNKGDSAIDYSIFRQSDGWELCSGHYETGTLKSTLEEMFLMVDDYIKNPGDYE